MKKIILIGAMIGVAIGAVLLLSKERKDVIVTTVAKKAIDYLPAPEGQEKEMAVVTDIMKRFLTADGTTHRILILLQNNFELRPTGGFLGQFAVVELRNGHVVRTEIVDANVFDKEIKSDRPAPPVLAKYMGIKKWKFRDANWSPDFPTAVQDVLHFYGLKPGNNTDFDAVVAMNATLLNELLAITGDITIRTKSRQRGAFDVTFTAADGAWTLQQAVEKEILLRDEAVARAEAQAEATGERYKEPRDENGKKIRRVKPWERHNRKQIMKDLGNAIVERLMAPTRLSTTIPQMTSFALEALARKDIQLWFKDPALQAQARTQHWTGEVDTQWDGDYVMVVDANLGSLKTDRHITRTIEHTVDFRGLGAEVNNAAAGRMVRYRTADLKERVMAGNYRAPGPLATTRVTYEHAAQAPDWSTSDYHSYTRLIVPAGAHWLTREWFFAPSVDTETFANRTVYGYKFDVLINDPNFPHILPTMLQYTLPSTITDTNYAFKIQKQSGTGTIPFRLTVITTDGTRYTYSADLTHDLTVTLADMTRE